MHLQHYDKLLAVSGVTASNSAAPEGKSSSRDISELLAQEVEDLKDRKQQRFKSHNVDVRGCTFVIFPETPGEGVLLVTYMLNMRIHTCPVFQLALFYNGLLVPS